MREIHNNSQKNGNKYLITLWYTYIKELRKEEISIKVWNYHQKMFNGGE